MPEAKTIGPLARKSSRSRVRFSGSMRLLLMEGSPRSYVSTGHGIPSVVIRGASARGACVFPSGAPYAQIGGGDRSLCAPGIFTDQCLV
jgi:hypothetical protein